MIAGDYGKIIKTTICICIMTGVLFGVVIGGKFISFIDEKIRVMGIHKPIRAEHCDPCHDNWTKDRWKVDGKHN